MAVACTKNSTFSYSCRDKSSLGFHDVNNYSTCRPCNFQIGAVTSSSRFASAPESDTTVQLRLYKKLVAISWHMKIGGSEELWGKEKTQRFKTTIDNPPVVKPNGNTDKPYVFYQCPKLYMAILHTSGLLKGGLSTDIYSTFQYVYHLSFCVCISLKGEGGQEWR